jgi:hypothetical protein
LHDGSHKTRFKVQTDRSSAAVPTTRSVSSGIRWSTNSRCQEPHRRPRPANQGRVRLAASSLARMAVATCARQACGCKLIGMLAGYLLFSSLLSLLAVVVRLRLANPSLSLALPWSSYSYACCNDSKHGFINIRTRVQIWVPLFSTLLFAKIDHHQPAAVSYGLV